MVFRAESVLDGLTREVLEETGLVVTEWEGPIYEIEVVAPDRRNTLRSNDMMNVLVEGDKRGIERAAAEIIDQDRFSTSLRLPLPVAKLDACGTRLVQHPEDSESGGTTLKP